MSVLFVTLLPCLLAGPLYTQALFREVWENQKRIILLDNAAIRWGRSQRALFNELRQFNRKAERFDRLHHLWHVCARTPGPKQATCVAMDNVIEKNLSATVLAARAWALSRWHAASHEAIHALELIREPVVRVPPPPFVLRRCPICRCDTFLDISSHSLKAHFAATDRREFPKSRVTVELIGQSLRQPEDWNYALDVR